MSEYSRRVSKKISKLSDEQIKTFLSSISSENEMLTSVFSSLSTGLIIVDDTWKVLLANKASERYLPFSVRLDDAKMENMQISKLLDKSEISDFLEECYKNNKTNVSSEFTLSTQAGSIRFINISVLPFLQMQELKGYIIMVNDVTEKRNQEILLHRMESLAGLTNLAASMAHEIKNPLGAIGIHVQLMQKALQKARDENGKLPDKKFLENHLEVVNEEIDSLNKKLMDFLMAVRPVNARLELLDVGKILQDALSFIGPEFQNNHITVRKNIEKMNTKLLIDEKLFKEFFINIAQNSLFALKEKYSACTASSFSVCPGIFSVESVLKNDSYIITIFDNGSGMDEETSNHIFEPYFTTKASGTGLGMTMTYKIIKEFSGDISVSSVKGEGTTFTIVLPVPQTNQKLLPKNTAINHEQNHEQNHKEEKSEFN